MKRLSILKKDTTSLKRGKTEKTKTKKTRLLPKTAREIDNGGVYKQSVKCGKKNCKCVRGEKHIAYYFFTRFDGKLTKTYIRKAELEAFIQLVAESKNRKKEYCVERMSDAELIRNMNRLARERDLLLKALKCIYEPGEFEI